MQGAFATVVWIVSAVGVVGAIVGLLLNRRPWDQYGSDHLVLAAELDAQNVRRRRRGEPETDVEQELRRLTGAAPAIDAGLRDEIRDLVIARNHRRARRGEPALDVDAEVERQITELSRPIK